MNTPPPSDELTARMRTAYTKLHSELVMTKLESGYWDGELSVSALSTATAVSALAVAHKAGSSKSTERADPVSKYSRENWRALIEKGGEWLSHSQNPDGGFGDTNRSTSNIATTLLVLAAWELAGLNELYADQRLRAQGYVQAQGHWDGLRRRYGKDKTFVVPIMTNCALAGQIAWAEIPTLPFEAAALPQSWYRFAKMPVVSYAVPALVAIGQAQLVHNPPRNPIVRVLRNSVCKRTLDVLQTMQPESGGYLEATPLTSFVLMNLASIGLVDHPVCRNSVRFIIDSVSSEGSWPIDTNLATWVTSLTTRSFYPQISFSDARKRIQGNNSLDIDLDHFLSQSNRQASEAFSEPLTANSTQNRCEQGEIGVVATSKAAIKTDRCTEDLHENCCAASELHEWGKSIDWILSCQHLVRHPFTGAEPGGWGWTNLTGSVPDSDDTPAALLALRNYFAITSDLGEEQFAQDISQRQAKILVAASRGCDWLLKLQNRDGGWPTFCRGWGTLPFDRSGSDLTAHAIRALNAWKMHLSSTQQKQVELALKAGWRYLAKKQFSDGSWQPLWFGNQDRPDEDNPFYGTARVLLAFADCGLAADPMALAGVAFLKHNQNADGSWGGGTSISYRSSNISCRSGNLGQSSRLDVLNGPPKTTYPSDGVGADTICGTLEETAVVLEALISCCGKVTADDSIMKGVKWVCDAIDGDYHHVSQPIGFYFAKLWYHEKQYPLAFSLAALRKGLEFCQ